MYNTNTYSNQYSNVTDYSLCYLNFRIVNNPTWLVLLQLVSLLQEKNQPMVNSPSHVVKYVESNCKCSVCDLDVTEHCVVKKLPKKVPPKVSEIA